MLKRLMSVLLAAALIFAAFGVIPASAEDAAELAGTGADADVIAATGGMLWTSVNVCGDYEYGLDEDGNAHITKYSGVSRFSRQQISLIGSVAISVNQYSNSRFVDFIEEYRIIIG